MPRSVLQLKNHRLCGRRGDLTGRRKKAAPVLYGTGAASLVFAFLPGREVLYGGF